MSLTNLCKKNILCDLMPVDKRDARIFWLNIHREIDFYSLFIKRDIQRLYIVF